MSEALQEALGIDIQREFFGDYPDNQWFNNTVTEHRKILIADYQAAGEDIQEILDPWTYLSSGASQQEKIQDVIGSALLLVPTHLSWQVPLILRYGHYNKCPSPEMNVSVMKRWEALYGAELVTLTSYIEMHCQRPPSDRISALQLAWEHQTYCAELGYEPIEFHAARLFHGQSWHFEWD